MKDTSKNINGWDIDTLLSILAPGYDSDDRPYDMDFYNLPHYRESVFRCLKENMVLSDYEIFSHGMMKIVESSEEMGEILMYDEHQIDGYIAYNLSNYKANFRQRVLWKYGYSHNFFLN